MTHKSQVWVCDICLLMLILALNVVVGVIRVSECICLANVIEVHIGTLFGVKAERWYLNIGGKTILITYFRYICNFVVKEEDGTATVIFPC